jgi:hypothetical protein
VNFRENSQDFWRQYYFISDISAVLGVTAVTYVIAVDCVPAVASIPIGNRIKA